MMRTLECLAHAILVVTAIFIMVGEGDADYNTRFAVATAMIWFSLVMFPSKESK